MWNALLIEQACMCQAIRRVSRNLSNRYDEALKPTGLTIGQFSILSALRRPQPVRLSALAQDLGMNRTTLTRDLKPLEARGLIVTTPDPDDARARQISISEKGMVVHDAALPLWEAVQTDTAERLAGEDWQALRPILDRLVA